MAVESVNNIIIILCDVFSIRTAMHNMFDTTWLAAAAAVVAVAAAAVAVVV